MVNIKKQLVKDTPNKLGRSNKRTYITIHETANTSKGANAQAHANLQSNGNSRAVNWHWQVDDKQAIQSFTHDFSLYAAGDGKGTGNRDSIHIEICVNSDGDYVQAVKNAAALTRKIMSQEGIPLGRVVQHNHWSGKNCPAGLRAGKQGLNWHKFISVVRGISVDQASKPQTKPKPSTPSTSKPTSKGDMKTTSIVTYLNSIGQNSTFAHRSKLAKQYGIKGYVGTAAQNTKLLSLLRGGSKPQANKPKPTKTVKQMADEVVKGLHGNGHAQRQKSLGVDNATYNKVKNEVNKRF